MKRLFASFIFFYEIIKYNFLSLLNCAVSQGLIITSSNGTATAIIIERIMNFLWIPGRKYCRFYKISFFVPRYSFCTDFPLIFCWFWFLLIFRPGSLEQTAEIEQKKKKNHLILFGLACLATPSRHNPANLASYAQKLTEFTPREHRSTPQDQHTHCDLFGERWRNWAVEKPHVD